MTMDVNTSLPFKVGQQAESKSFQLGFRGAWFRCKIKSISSQKGQIGYSLEFFDFPDEKIRWTKLYQKATRGPNLSGVEGRLELMVRPSFPSVYQNGQLPDSSSKSDVMVIVDDIWKVGDLVDWWCASCYWSGRVTDVLGDDKVQIKLPDPPIGEGKYYEALCKDLRPSLNWSPQLGWTVPISREFGNSQHCAWLLQPSNQDPERRSMGPNLEFEDTREPTPSSFLQGLSSRSHDDIKDLSDSERNVMGMNLKSDDTREPTRYSLYEGTSSHGDTDDPGGLIAKVSSKRGRHNSSESPQRILSGGRGYVTPVRYSDTIESSIMALEELANKFRWLKGLLQFGSEWSNEMQPSWKLLEDPPHQGSKEP